MNRVLGLALALVLVTLPATAATTTIVVTPTQGDPVQSGLDLLSALDSITYSNFHHRFVVKLEAGTYNLLTENLAMKEYVDIAGSGVESTFVYGKGNPSQNSIFRGLVEGADFAELRDLTVKVFHTATRQDLVGMHNPGVSPRVTNVVFEAFDSPGQCIGLFNRSSSAVLKDVTVRTQCRGNTEGVIFDGENATPALIGADIMALTTGIVSSSIGVGVFRGNFPEIRDSKVIASGGQDAVGLRLRSDESPPSVLVATNSTFEGQWATNSYGVLVESGLEPPALQFRHCRIAGVLGQLNTGLELRASGATVDIDSCTVEGASTTINNAGVFSLISVGGSKLAGGTFSGDGRCAGTYDENFTFYPNSCPP